MQSSLQGEVLGEVFGDGVFLGEIRRETIVMVGDPLLEEPCSFTGEPPTAPLGEPNAAGELALDLSDPDADPVGDIGTSSG